VSRGAYWVGHVVQAIKERYQIEVLAMKRSCICNLKPCVDDTGVLCPLGCRFDGKLMIVVTDEFRLREGFGSCGQIQITSKRVAAMTWVLS
jgi:hypothetical protein